MAVFSVQNPLILTFGILGNIVSFMVYLSPLPTFYRVVKKKSTEEFQSLPYVVALFSAMLWIYYASVKLDETLLITINSVGCVIETIYIALYIAYAPKKERILTLKLLLLSIGGFCSILILTQYLAKGSKRVEILGWICMTMSASVYIAPLCIMKQVIRTKSVEFMPFWLTFFLGLSAIMWLFYGLLLRDLYIVVPNIVGLIFGILQMVLYIIYKHFIKEREEEEQKLPTIMMPTTVKTNEIHPVVSLPIQDESRHSSTTCRNEHDQIVPLGNSISVINQLPVITA